MVADVRSDDEETEGEVEEKEGEGVEVGISGGEKKEKAVERVRENGVKPVNGKVVEPNGSYADGVVEGKKER